MWDFPGAGIELVSPALAGGFFITEPSGKPFTSLLNKKIFLMFIFKYFIEVQQIYNVSNVGQSDSKHMYIYIC